MSPRPRSRTLGRAPTTRKALVGLGVAATALLAFPAVAGAQEADPVVVARPAGQPAVDRHRRRPRHLHAGRLRAGRDRLLPGQARRPRGEHELRHLRARASWPSSSSATRFMFGGYSYVLPGFDFGYDRAARRTPHRLRRLGLPLEGRLRPRPTGRRPAGPASLGFFLYMVAFMDTVATIPTGAMAERWKWKSFVALGPLLRRHLLPALRRVDLGRRLAQPARQHRRARLRLRRLRRLRRRPRHGRRRCPGRCHRARSSHRQVQRRRHAEHHPRPPHPDGHARHVHPAVRVVRLQRRLDLRGDRRAVRRRGRQHGHRRRLRRRRRDVLHA